jgi:hypothetical protein
LKLLSKACAIFVAFTPTDRRARTIMRMYRLLVYINHKWYRIIIAYLVVGLFQMCFIGFLMLMKYIRLDAIALAVSIVYYPIFIAIVLPAFTVILLLLMRLYLSIGIGIFVRPPLWILERPDLSALSRDVSFLMLIVGFCFDMLAS